MSRRSPAFGSWGHPDSWGETAKARTTRPPPATHLDDGGPCPDCRAPIWWDTDGHGGTLRLDLDGRVHLCQPDAVLRLLEPREGRLVLRQLRRVLNERRMYGAVL